MTRYSNPLPHNQVPNTQGRPAGTGPQPAQAAHAGQAQWPAPNGAAPQRPALQQGYADPLGYALDPQTGGQQAGPHQSGFAQDLYAALRPDGYGYTQPPQSNPDPYGLAGYTAPQPAAAPQQPVYTRAPQAPAPVQSSYPNSADSYASNGYGHQPVQPSAFANAQAATAQAHAYGAQGYGAQHQADASAFGSFGGGQPGAGYPAPRSNGADQWGDQALSLDARDYGHAEAGPG
ncbi:MAG TPA: hypothetical protein VEA77_02360, partial [Hyphomicrobium sp.]|nr:hypothetical protein [Hyphomicrobium sp.]